MAVDIDLFDTQANVQTALLAASGPTDAEQRMLSEVKTIALSEMARLTGPVHCNLHVAVSANGKEVRGSFALDQIDQFGGGFGGLKFDDPP